MANELGQPTAQEIAEKFCTEMLCNALLCEGCPVNEMIKAAQQNVQRTCPKCGGSIIEGTPSHYLECKYAVASR